MKTKKNTVVLTVLVLLSGGLVLASEDPAPQEISNTRIANVMVKISCDPEILPLSPYMVENLVLNYGVAGKAANEVLKMSPDDIYEYLSVEVLPVQGKPVQLRTSRGLNRRVRRDRGEDDEAFFDERAMQEMENFGAPKFSRKRYSKATETRLSTKIWQSLLLRLHVDLRETDTRPAAQEFMAVVVRNLRRTLESVYNTHQSQLEVDIGQASNARRDAEQDLREATGIPNETKADIATKKQLEQVVELSDLNPGMGFGDALDVLRNSVTPPFRISVIWGELVDYDIDQSIAINMDPIRTAAVGTALELLLKSVSARMMELGDILKDDTKKLGYVIKDGIIVISRVDELPASQQMLLQLEPTNLPREVLLERKKQLFIEIQHEELNVATGQAQRLAYEERIAEVQHQMAS